MAFKDWWSRLFKTQNQSRLMTMPLWTSDFGTDVYESDIVLACIHTIAEETSKMILKSVKVKEGNVVTNEDDLNVLFQTRPNKLMTMKDMLYWIAWRLEVKSNAYVFPDVETVTYGDGSTKTRIAGLYPIDSLSEEMYYDENTGDYSIKFSMRNGSVYTIAYDHIIHLRKYYTSDNYYFGKISRTDLLKTLQVKSTITELLPKGIKASMQTKGVLTAKALASVNDLKKFKTEFESNLASGDTAISVLDVAGDFTPVSINPQMVDPNVLSYLEKNVLSVFGVSINVLAGNGTEQEWSSLYQKNIEPLKIEIEQAFSSILFNARELSFGNRVKCYDKLVQHYTINTRLAIVKELGARNYLTRAEQRELAGFEPDGGPEKVSLNFVDQDKANQYQGVGGQQSPKPEPKPEETNPNEGGTTK